MTVKVDYFAPANILFINLHALKFGCLVCKLHRKCIQKTNRNVSVCLRVYLKRKMGFQEIIIYVQKSKDKDKCQKMLNLFGYTVRLK